jgi:(E)-4-hydroxy-3-methylbut-2-enyl-diphosphate synthase
MENEVIAGREILALAAEMTADNTRDDRNAYLVAGKLRRYKGGQTAKTIASAYVTIVSCPRCGRNGFDTHGFTARWLNRLYALKKRCTIAIMGCAVNGPEEARHADLGITGAGDKVLIFLHGKIARTVDAACADEAFAEELEKL